MYMCNFISIQKFLHKLGGAELGERSSSIAPFVCMVDKGAMGERSSPNKIDPHYALIISSHS